jgi:hypothetical protein
LPFKGFLGRKNTEKIERLQKENFVDWERTPSVRGAKK